MALLPYVDEASASESLRDLLERSPVKLNVLLMLANSESAFRGFRGLSNALLRQGTLEPRLRELAILRTAKVSRSVYEWTQHVPAARYVGVTEEQLEALDDPEGSPAFDELEALVVRFAGEVAANVKGERETLEALKRHLGPGEIVELILAIGFWGMVARVLETTEVDLEPFAGQVNILDPQLAPRV